MEPHTVIKLENGNTLEIFQSDADDPREWDNLTTMVCFHKRYTLGDKNDYNSDDYDGWEEMEEAIIAKEKPVIIKPLYMYDHSGITINTSGFSCPWDSGQIGFVFITNKQINLLGTTIKDGETFADYKQRLDDYLESEVETYDQYITGDVHGFRVLSPDNEEIDSCHGFFGTNWKNNGLTDHVELSEKDFDKL